MAKSPFSTAGGGSSDARPHEFAARKHGGAVKAPHHKGHHRAEGGKMVSGTMKEAKGHTVGTVEGEDVKPRLDRKAGGKAHCARGGKAEARKHGGKVEHHAKGGEAKHRAEGGAAHHGEKHGHEHEHGHSEVHHHVHHHEHHEGAHGGRE